MARNRNPPPPSEVRTFVNPHAIRFDTSDGHSLHYYREWHGLELRFESYRLSRILSSNEADFGVGPDAEDDELLRDAYAEYAAMSPDAKERFRQIQMKERRAATHPDVRRLQGMAEIVNNRTLRVFEAGRDGKPQGDFDRTFRQVYVNIRSFGDEDPGGGLFFPTIEETFRSDHGSDGHPMLDLVVRREVLEELERAMREGRHTPMLTVHADALLYQSEVDRSLSEPYERQDFAMLKEVFTPAVLAHLVWDETPHADQTASAPTGAASTIRRAPTSPAAQDAPSPIRGLTVAVWALVVVVAVGMLIR